MSQLSAIIKNPLPFMTENYMKTKVLVDKYVDTKINMVLKNELPCKIFLTFSSEELCKSFLENYNKKFF